MTNTRKIVKVFLASPGDLVDERKVVKDVVDDINDLLAEEFGYQVDLVGWESTTSTAGRPQAIINKDLERCELFIGMVWKRWGTAPDLDSNFASGFEEEFWTSFNRHSREGYPEISLFFKNVEETVRQDPGEQLKNVLAFRQRLIDEKIILFEDFYDTRDFEKRIRRCVIKYIRKLREAESERISERTQSPLALLETESPTPVKGVDTKSPFSDEGATFIRNLIAKTERFAKDESISAVEVAVLRLLANIVQCPGNDETSLGVHDANLIYISQPPLGASEHFGLVEIALMYFASENVPLWHWYAAQGGFTVNNLTMFSMIGSEAQRVGALNAMALISEPIRASGEYSRAQIIADWLSQESTVAVRLAALIYLRECGQHGDLAVIRKEFDKNESRTLNPAADSIISIALKESRERGFVALFELQPSYVNNSVLTRLFQNLDALPDDLLLKGVDHRSSEVRRKIISALQARNALPSVIAEKLLSDSHPAVRYAALESLIANGRLFSDEEAKSILVKTAQNALLGLAAISGLDDNAFWQKYQDNRLRSFDDQRLTIQMQTEWILNIHARFVLTERHFKKFGLELRQSIDDQFRAEYSRAIDKAISDFGESVSLISQLRSIEEDVRIKLTERALTVLCKMGNSTDLRRVRLTLGNSQIAFLPSAIDYLAKYGEWEDIPLIINMSERPKRSKCPGLLTDASNGSAFKRAAKLIVVLGKGRLTEVLSKNMHNQLLAHVVANMPNRAFAQLPKASIIQLFDSESETVRKVTALKSVRSLSKSEIEILLYAYLGEDGQRYYNVIHWLDFGISVLRSRATTCAENILLSEWKA